MGEMDKGGGARQCTGKGTRRSQEKSSDPIGSRTSADLVVGHFLSRKVILAAPGVVSSYVGEKGKNQIVLLWGGTIRRKGEKLGRR